MAEQDIIKVRQKANVVVKSFLNKNAEGITDVTREGNEWKVRAEVVERKAVPDTQDIIATYEIKMTEDLVPIGYKRMRMRHRGDTAVEQEE